jgi:hypothetical protein
MDSSHATVRDDIDPSTLSDDELAALLHRAEEQESVLSRRRSVLHERIDFLRTGGGAQNPATEDQLEALGVRERDLAEERRAIHDWIDALRTERRMRRAGNIRSS